ncbi:hypothetical protein PTSG_00010 [Salpingoeca rosetta]|uniref:Exportin-T n=1 Tax=Salpingoeca rosetta (strain ATCC 50818 / BSB-021) TaxID=946362 RepID=F2TV98_SALR5|nr:uncharacterized protein PTSG_00010 [Salpingoeca rosetta]EGD71994.1 hypothetical protein PTSG_00010 [Salpingoeca rosetta]|eukprot:XP_004998566.1 hypothetical protein PTSG_00010 [Salpingoeca rosetta]
MAMFGVEKDLLVYFSREVQLDLSGDESPGREVEANELDVQQQPRDLRRAYFTLIGAIVNAGLAHVGALEDVFMTLIQACVASAGVDGASASPDDPKAIKSCFGSLRELTRQWFSEDGTCSVPEFEAFARQHLVQACFTTILQPSFDVNELQYYGALGEIALVLLLLAHAYGSEFLEYIRSEYLHQLLSPDLAQEFVAHIDQSAAVSLKAGKKRLSAFLKHFLLRMRSSSGSPPTAA